MKKMIFASCAAIGALSMAACSEQTADQVEQAGDAVGNDIERGINNADDAIASGLNKTGAAIERAGERVGAATDEAARDAKEATSNAKQETGAALEKAGRDMQN